MEDPKPAAATGGVLAGLFGGIFLVLMAMGVGVCLAGALLIAALSFMGDEIGDKTETIAENILRNRRP